MYIIVQIKSETVGIFNMLSGSKKTIQDNIIALPVKESILINGIEHYKSDHFICLAHKIDINVWNMILFGKRNFRWEQILSDLFLMNIELTNSIHFPDVWMKHYPDTICNQKIDNEYIEDQIITKYGLIIHLRTYLHQFFNRDHHIILNQNFNKLSEAYQYIKNNSDLIVNNLNKICEVSKNNDVIYNLFDLFVSYMNDFKVLMRINPIERIFKEDTSINLREINEVFSKINSTYYSSNPVTVHNPSTAKSHEHLSFRYPGIYLNPIKMQFTIGGIMHLEIHNPKHFNIISSTITILNLTDPFQKYIERLRLLGA